MMGYHRYTAAVPHYPELEKLTPESLVITGNVRLARHLLAAYGRQQVDAGHQAWAQPRIMPWQSWLKQCWQEVAHLSKLSLLSDAQSRLVWEQVINQQLDEHFTLLNLHASARSAQQAWQLLHDWNLALTDLGTQVDEDVAVFLDWARLYNQQCTQKNWLDEARLGEHIYNSIAADELTLPDHIMLAGLAELTPLQQKIINLLRTRDITVAELNPEPQPGTPQRISLPATRDEIKAAGQWARQVVTNNPHARVAIVIPKLGEVRADVVRILDRQLCVAHTLPGNQDQPRPYDISLGLPLSDYPLVFDGLLSLECLNHRLGIEKISRLLGSVFAGEAGSESHARALLDTWLREQGATSIRVDMLARVAKGLRQDGEPGAHACPQLAARLSALVEFNNALPTRQSCHDWAQCFSKVLNIFGWPGDRSLSSAEYQTVERWRETLETFSAMEHLCDLVTLHEALGQLRALANETIFQPETESVPVTVLGALEAKDLVFDAMWILGLNDEDWPQAPRPHPLLPTRMQRELAMPHASAERELEFARTLTRDLLSHAREVIVSAPQREGDKDLRPSPLIIDLPLVELDEIIKSRPEDYLYTLHRQGRLEAFVDEHLPPLATGMSYRGGTGLIKLQAQCPFSAFARYRLGAQPLADCQEGLTAMERGSLVHRVLELLWGNIKDQKNLLALAEDETEKIISQCVQQAINEQARFKPETYTARFIEIEKSRLARLMSQWLEEEKKRAPFRVVAPEEEQFVTIAGMTLKLIIDRIDELESGDHLLIDYKTGRSNNLNNWFDDRPREPQLPMYAYLGNELGQPPVGLAFAQLAAGDLKFIGLADRDGIAPGIKDISSDDKHGALDWTTQVNEWKNVLENLARQFVNGEASVNPKDDNSCSYCPYPELCRINELNQRLGHLAEVNQNGGEPDDYE